MIKLKEININNLSLWLQQAKNQTVQGRVIERIPLLSVANPSCFAVNICGESGVSYSLGDTACVFPLMSVIKPFSLLYLLEYFGAEKVSELVGFEPSAAPFNSLEQLISDNGYPRNPMINSGAITLADKLPGKDVNTRTQLFCQWLNQLAGTQLHIDLEMLTSVRATRSQVNLAIAHYLIKTGHIKNLEIALDTYEQICCISGVVQDLALLGTLLACNSSFITSENRNIVHSVMLSCGLYEASAEYAVKIGLPMKSGIGGGLLAIVPNQGAIGCYSPALDSIGNPLAGLAFMEALSQGLKLNM
ncbi:glutaminase [Anabaena sp. PCC 7108]|uniref:glutaminase n=1 Tax=Anabaena sp. PCC 7108 TaxID=163908 RepID=UPI00034DB19C|nr:glutaminase [Anabaena sp. PCC 7108]